jgi:exopolyphosphatase/guanosine-5'-triphosphate,3'-diphosphate pyrophosphatase
MRLLRRHIHNVVEDIRREMPLREAKRFVALGGDVRFAVARLEGERDKGVARIGKDAFLAFCDKLAAEDVEQIVLKYRLPPAEAETLVPALLAYEALLRETAADQVTVPDASLRAGLLIDVTGGDEGQALEDMQRQVLASAQSVGEKYRYDAAHAKQVALLATRLFDELRGEHGLGARERLLLEVAALLHDVGIYVSLRGHHKHTWYLLSSAEIFGLTRDDMAVVANVARYHRRATPQKSHLPYMALDSETRVVVNKLSAILRLANALDADHLQKVKELSLLPEEGGFVLEVTGVGDLTMERLVAMARAELLVEVFGRKLSFREAPPRP